MKDHRIGAWVNRITATAKTYSVTQQLRERIKRDVLELIAEVETDEITRLRDEVETKNTELRKLQVEVASLRAKEKYLSSGLSVLGMVEYHREFGL